MIPIKVKAAIGIYGAPPGLEAEVGGLPYWRESSVIAGRRISSVFSAWQLEPHEIEAINSGGVVILEIVGMEPIPPVSLQVAIDLPGQPDPRAQRVEALG
jgi:hypothetical protein